MTIFVSETFIPGVLIGSFTTRLINVALRTWEGLGTFGLISI